MTTKTRLAAIAVAVAIAVAACGGSDTGTTAPSAPSAPATTAPAADAIAAPSDSGTPRASTVEPADVDWGDLDRADQQLFTQMAQIDSTFRTRAGEVWDGSFRFDQTPVALPFRNKDGEITKVYLFHHPGAASLPGARRVELDESLGLGDVYRIDTPASIAKIETFQPYDFDVDIAGVSSMVLFIDANAPVGPSTWDFSRYLVHETFHRYQFEQRWGDEVPGGDDYPRVAGNAALAALEDRVLDQMTRSDDKAEIARRLAQFVAIRNARAESFKIGSVDDEQERNEGLARYVENRLAEINGRRAKWSTDQFPEMTGDWLTFGRFYSTGAAIGWALDRLDADYRSAVAAGTSLADLAANAPTGDDQPSPAELIEQAKTEFDYAKLLADAEAADLQNT